MVREKTTYHTEFSYSPYWLYSDQIAADRDAAVEAAKPMCDDACTLSAVLMSRDDMLDIKCTSRMYETNQAAEDQEAVCRAAQFAVWNCIEGQAALVREERRIDS